MRFSWLVPTSLDDYHNLRSSIPRQPRDTVERTRISKAFPEELNIRKLPLFSGDVDWKRNPKTNEPIDENTTLESIESLDLYIYPSGRIGNLIAYCYQNGYGCEKDIDCALRLYRNVVDTTNNWREASIASCQIARIETETRKTFAYYWCFNLKREFADPEYLEAMSYIFKLDDERIRDLYYSYHPDEKERREQVEKEVQKNLKKFEEDSLCNVM